MIRAHHRSDVSSKSRAAAESLSKYEGDLDLDLDDIPESAAAILR